MSRKLVCELVALFLLTTTYVSNFISDAYGDEVTLGQLPGVRLNADWFRYVNLRFGLAIDIPLQGTRPLAA